jgi:hypothetical protein
LLTRDLLPLYYASLVPSGKRTTTLLSPTIYDGVPPGAESRSPADPGGQLRMSAISAGEEGRQGNGFQDERGVETG